MILTYIYLYRYAHNIYIYIFGYTNHCLHIYTHTYICIHISTECMHTSIYADACIYISYPMYLYMFYVCRCALAIYIGIKIAAHYLEQPYSKAIEVLLNKRAFVVKRIGDPDTAGQGASKGQVTWNTNGGVQTAWAFAKRKAHWGKPPSKR